MNKKCPQCNVDKNIDEFGNCKQRGKKVYCKECTSVNSKKYRLKNKERLVLYRESNSDRQSEYFKEYYLENKDIIKNKSKSYYVKNIESKLEYQRKYSLENRVKINEYKKKKYYENHHISAWRYVLKNTIKRMLIDKNDSTINMLGYSAEELKKHISNLLTDGMSWDNYGEWHIDHIKPVSLFDRDTPMSVVCALSNLQPLWATTREINGIIYEGNLNKNNFFNIE
jgi:hypothetical protein